MAERPIFIPNESGKSLVREVPIQFVWNPGMAPSQKKKNIAALHMRAEERGYFNVLEISSKSDREIGQSISAFKLEFVIDGKKTTVECAFQSSKVFEHGGPYEDLLFASSKEAKSDPRLRSSGRLIGFEYQGDRFPLSPLTVFYDWLYINALYRHVEWHQELMRCSGFTDIEFNPAKSINCQARSAAAFVALKARDEIDDALDSFSIFRSYF